MDDKKTPLETGDKSRRGFLKKSALAAAAMATSSNVFKTPVYGQHQAPATGAVLGANDRLVIGFIAVGGHGFNANHRNGVKANADENNVVGAAVCDLWDKRKEQAREELGLS
jgi:hypothetical protein